MSEKPEKQETVAGVGIMAAAFTNEEAGEEALKALKKARSQRQVYFEDAAVIRQDADGEVHYHETEVDRLASLLVPAQARCWVDWLPKAMPDSRIRAWSSSAWL
jgi:hypothetical protein